MDAIEEFNETVRKAVASHNAWCFNFVRGDDTGDLLTRRECREAIIAAGQRLVDQACAAS